MTGFVASIVNAAAGSAKSTGSIGVAAGLPAGQNLVEGTEANLMVGAAAANSDWRKAGVALGAALVTLVPLLGGIWFLYQAGGAYADYAVAIIVFLIGVHEVMEGWGDRPKGRSGPRAHALAGPLGIDPADPDAVKRFQSSHGLRDDGVLGRRTRGAIVAELHRRGEAPTSNRLGVDVTDEASVADFQRRVGLRPDGVVGPRTQGALAAESARPVPDPADPDAVRRFQHRHHLAETGIVDTATQGALRVADGAFRSPVDGRKPFADGIDLTDGAAVERFQRDRGLPTSGTVDAMTQGALRAEIVWHRRLPPFDPADPTAVRAFQSARGLAATAVVDEPTQAALQVERPPAAEPDAGHWADLGIDPTDHGSIERFQALHDLERSGAIDERTRLELRRTEAWTAGVDPADAASVTRFQRRQGLAPTGEVDAETQGAMRLVRTELQERHDVALPDDCPAWCPVDPTDRASIEAFQQGHELPERATIGPATQAALRELVAERARRALEPAGPSGGALRRAIDRYRDAWPGYFGFLLEGGEAGLFTVGIAQGTHQYTVAAIAGGAAFAFPWLGMIWLRDWLQSRPQWVFELTIGVILAAAATIFGSFRASGIFG